MTIKEIEQKISDLDYVGSLEGLLQRLTTLEIRVVEMARLNRLEQQENDKRFAKTVDQFQKIAEHAMVVTSHLQAVTDAIKSIANKQ